MKIRALYPSDMEEVRKIHEKFYQREFSYEDFTRKFHSSYIVRDDNNEIIVAGGLKPLMEAVLVTNKDLPVRKRVHGLLAVLDVSRDLVKRIGIDSIHAFIQDETWMRHLESIGFVETAGKSLVIKA